MEKTSKKKVLSWINFIVSAAIFAFALSVFIISFTARSQNRQAEIFGFSFAVVVTDSMYPEIKVGDMIIVKSCDITEIEEGENAVFIGLSGEYEGKYIVHKVIGIYDDIDETGEKTGICLETQGINNPCSDDDYVYADNFVGREIFHSALLGSVMTFLQDPLNWMYVFVIVLAISFGMKHVIKIVKLIKNRNKEEDGQELEQEEKGEEKGEANEEQEIKADDETEKEKKEETKKTE